MRITAFTKYGRMAASTRQRILQYVPALNAAGFEIVVHSLLGDDYVASIAEGRRYSRFSIAQSYIRRFKQVLGERDMDIVWIYAEMFPYLPPHFERLALRSGKPIVYDIDDAFFVPYDENPNPLVRSVLAGKLVPLIKNAAMVCCGNRVLQDYATRFTSRTTLLPTVVATNVFVPKQQGLPNSPTVIGWIGSPSTWCNVVPLLPLLEKMCRSGLVRFKVIGAGPAAAGVRFNGLELIPWVEQSEVSEIQSMDIGIMPLLDRPFQRGKSGYKLIQYMACGLPSVASPVGVNREIIEDGTNGMLASTIEEWGSALHKLIAEPELRRVFAGAARQKAVSFYSLATHGPRLVEIMKSVL